MQAISALIVFAFVAAESKYPWDFYKLIATIPAEEAFKPLAQSECPLVKKN